MSAASKDGWTPLHAAVAGASLDARSHCDPPSCASPMTRITRPSRRRWMPATCSSRASSGLVAPVALVIELTLGARATEYSETSAPHNPRQRADLRARTNEGNEPLHVAADKGHLELAQWLVRTTKGENVCSRDDDGWQPMHNAAINGHLEVCKWLWGQRGRYPEVRPDTRLRCRVAALLCKCARPPHPSGGPAGYLARRLATVACRSPRRPFGRDPMDGQSRRQRHCGHERRVDSAARGGSRWPSRGGHLARGARCVDSRACDER